MKMLKILKEYFLWIMLIIMITIGIIATVCIFYFSKNCNQAGTIGDTLSGVFTSLAFICAIIAIILQSNELSLQREELKQTRTELENQKKEFQIQNQTLKRQQFENTFFKLFSLFMEIKDKVGVVEYNQNNKGEKYFSQILSDWNIDINKTDVNDNFFKKLIELKYSSCNGGRTIGVSGNFKDI